jgi:hypothetical protein
MLVVIAIVGILAVQAASSGYAFLSLWRLKSATGTFFNDLSFARSEAIKRNSRVVLCCAFHLMACNALPMAVGSKGGWFFKIKTITRLSMRRISSWREQVHCNRHCDWQGIETSASTFHTARSDLQI